jgi:hypothetical protein
MPESSTVFIWAIKELEWDLSDGFVFTAHYTVRADNGVHPPVGAYGSVGLERPAVLIPFDQLTEERVIDWVKTGLDAEVPGQVGIIAEVLGQVGIIEAELQARLDKKLEPTCGKGLPW